MVDENDRDGENRGEEKTHGSTNKNKKIMEGMRLSDRLECLDVPPVLANDNDAGAVNANADCEEVSVEDVF